jgi:hypothetical protein
MPNTTTHTADSLAAGGSEEEQVNPAKLQTLKAKLKQLEEKKKATVQRDKVKARIKARSKVANKFLCTRGYLCFPRLLV